MATAKTAKTDGAKSEARAAILTLAARCGLDDATIAYMLAQPLSDAEKASLAESAVKFPSPDTAEPLERAGMPAEAAKIRAAVKNAKTKYLACRGAQNFKYALDGDPKTRFTTGSTISAGDWIAFDFGFPKRVSEVSFDLGASARDFPDEFSGFCGRVRRRAFESRRRNFALQKRRIRQVPRGFQGALCEVCRGKGKAVLLVYSRAENRLIRNSENKNSANVVFAEFFLRPNFRGGSTSTFCSPRRARFLSALLCFRASS